VLLCVVDMRLVSSTEHHFDDWLCRLNHLSFLHHRSLHCQVEVSIGVYRNAIYTLLYKHGNIYCTWIQHGVKCDVSTVWVKKIPPYVFLKFFPKRLGIFNQFFTHLFCDHFYATVQIFVQLSPTLTKLCHTKRDHLANFYISLEL